MKRRTCKAAVQVIMCEGGCAIHHDGVLQYVHVTHEESKRDWGVFIYCESAIAEDISRGLNVQIVKEYQGI